MPETAPGAVRRHLRALPPGWLTAVAVVGVVLAVAPWWTAHRAPALPRVIQPESAEQRALVGIAAAADAACARGDTAALRAAVSPAQWQRIGSWMNAAGRSLDAAALRQQSYLVGDVGSMRFLYGASSDAAAVLVFSRLRAASLHDQGAALFGLLYTWDGSIVRLDGKRSAPLAPLDDPEVRAREWAQELLGSAR